VLEAVLKEAITSFQSTQIGMMHKIQPPCACGTGQKAHASKKWLYPNSKLLTNSRRIQRLSSSLIKPALCSQSSSLHWHHTEFQSGPSHVIQALIWLHT